MMLGSTTFSLYEQTLYAWATKIIQRFPKYVDFRLMKGVHALLGPGTSPSFVEKRSLSHLKRLLLIQFFLQKKVEEDLLQQKSPLLVKLFSIDTLLCIALIYCKQDSPLNEQIILDVASQKIPTLKKVDASFYQWENKKPSYDFCYIELEKMRGKKLLPIELHELGRYLQAEIFHYVSETSIFWPYNHEEIYKHLLILANEISSSKDSPQVSFHFRRQTIRHVEFLVYVARPFSLSSKKTFITDDCFPPSTQLTVHIKQEIDSKFPTLIEAFSFFVPANLCKKRNTMNLLYARTFVSKLFKDVIGDFRDYNGGLFETQEARLKEISQLFSHEIPHFSLFAKHLFYSLRPIEEQMSLSTSELRKLFEGFSTVISATSSLIHHPNPNVTILKTEDSQELIPYLKQVKKFQETNQIVAYGKLEIEAHHYLCILAKHPLFKNRPDTSAPVPRKKTTLRLAFQLGEIPSFHPYYLGKELRCYTIGKCLFEGLTRLDSTQRVDYAGCRKAFPSKDHSSYLFEIRNHCWSDGTEVTAFDYEKTWKKSFFKGNHFNPLHILKNGLAIKRSHQPLDALGVKALNERQLRVDLERPDPFFLKKLAHPAFSPTPEGFSEPRIFNGPFLIKEKKSHLLVLEKNPYYWNKKNVALRIIEVLFNDSSNTIYNSFQKNETDWLGAPFNWIYPININSPHAQQKKFRSFWLYINTESFPLSSSKIRQALSLAINRRFITKYIFPKSQPLFSVLPKHYSSYKENSIHSNSKKAQHLFAWGMKELGIDYPAFPPITLTCYDFPKSQKLAYYLKETWYKLFNINIQLDIKKWNSFFQQVDQGNFQLAGFFKDSSLDCGVIDLLENFSFKEFNYSLWSHPNYIKILNKLKVATNPKEETGYVKQAETVLLESAPVIPLFAEERSCIIRPDLNGAIVGQEGGVDLSFVFQKEAQRKSGTPA